MSDQPTGRDSYAWKYIETHQDDDYSSIAEALGYPEETIKSLCLLWALGNSDGFYNKLIHAKSTQKAMQIAENSHYGH